MVISMMAEITEKERTLVTETLCAPCTGTLVPLSSLPDPVFREKVLGDGFAVEPGQDGDGDIVSPVNGTVVYVQSTAHAVSIRSEEGLEILVHVGIDTVSMNGEGFRMYVKAGETVSRGERLLHADFEKIRRRGYGTACVVLISDMEKTERLEQRFPGGTAVRAGKTPVLSVDLYRNERKER